MTATLEMSLADPSARHVELAARQEAALHAIRLISRVAGSEIPIIPRDYAYGNEPGVYLLKTELQEDERPIKNVDFSVQPEMISGAADSAHAVLAGILRVDRGGQMSELPVAAKVYQKRTIDDRLLRVDKEVTVTRDMRRRGELALEPVAMAVAPLGTAEGAVVLLTKYEEGLFTLDSTPWGRGLTPDNIETATLAAETVGRFNAFGYAHYDAKIKNVAQRFDGKTGMIDFETVQEIDVNDPLQAASAAHVDLGLLLKSLQDKSLFTQPINTDGHKHDRKTSELIRVMCDAYLANWHEAPLDVQTAVLTAVSEVAEHALEQRSSTYSAAYQQA